MTSKDALRPPSRESYGVKILGSGSWVPSRVVTNQDLTAYMDTTDEWIRQRTGITERRVCDLEAGECMRTMGVESLKRAIEDAGIEASDIDLLIVGTVTGEMTCPSTACRIAAEVGANGAAAFDVTAACCGFVFPLNMAHEMIKSGGYRTVAVIGGDAMSSVNDYDNRGVSILFGDAAGAVILRRTDDLGVGIIASRMHSDGTGWKELYIPRHERDIPEGEEIIGRLGSLQMNGREVYKFASRKFPEVIEETLREAGASVEDVDHFVCHQSNARMLESAREKFGIPAEKLEINIDRFGNCSAGSVPLIFDELRKNGKCQPGEIVLFVAFGGGLTWGASLWRL